MPIVPGGPLAPEAEDVDVTDPAAPAPIEAADSLEEPPSVDEPGAPAETVEEPEAAKAPEAVDEDGLQVTERLSTVDVQEAAAAAAAEAEAEAEPAPEVEPEPTPEPEPESAPESEPAVATEPEPAEDEEEEFGDFVLPSDGEQSDESADGMLPTDSADIEIASPEDSLADAISDFASDADDDIRIEPASDAPDHSEDLEDELELSTSDMHVVDMEVEPEPEEPASTAPAIRAIPPPLPSVSASYVLRPFSEDSAQRKVVPIGAEAVVIGRDDGDVQVTDAFVSPHHARFSVHEATLYVDDLDSLNGVWLRVREESTIDADDELLVGQQILRIERTVARPENGATEDGTRRYGPSPGHATYRVVQIASDGQPLDRYHVAPGGSRIGRRLGDIVFTDDTYMSGTHVLLMPRSGALLVRDLSSRNGCWIRVRGRQALDTGDAVMIGRTVWRVGRPVA